MGFFLRKPLLKNAIGSGCRHALAFSDLHFQTPALPQVTSLILHVILFIKYFLN